MSKIIETLREQKYNILSTDNENTFHYPVGSGHNLVIDVTQKPDTWTLEKDGEKATEPPVSSVIEAEKFIKTYNLEKLELNEEIFDTATKEPAQKWKEGGAKALVKKQPTQKLPLAIPEDVRGRQIQDLTPEDIKNYINPLATDQEAVMFLRLCQARKLNPFLNEAYLIKYSPNEAAQFVTGKETFTRRAEVNPHVKGFKAGIIIRTKAEKDKPAGQIERRQGSFKLPEEELLGGWAEIHRDDAMFPFVYEVTLEEYLGRKKDGALTKMWREKPCTMIRKDALVGGLREAAPSEYGGLYDPAEVGLDYSEVYEAEYQEVQQEAL